MSEFAARLIAWHARHGRHDLPWQNTLDPYRVWLSEIMLQQTQVDTVMPYYARFLASFPTVYSLAHAPLDQVLALWAGLGYYARARNLHKAAQWVVSECGGKFPTTAAALVQLPGIGRSTAAAIASFCFGERVAILDGNVKRVLCRHFGIEGFPGERAIEQALWGLAESLVPQTGLQDLRIYPQAQMDLGATLCTRSAPACLLCPVQSTCNAYATHRQSILPTARPRKVVPQRSCGMLLITAGQSVLLEQRPASGIWGGLYSLPELQEGETAPQACQRRLGFTPDSLTERPVLRHTFTHFSLQITPWAATLDHPVQCAQEAGGLRWVDRNELGTLGLPAPIVKLLQI